MHILISLLQFLMDHTTIKNLYNHSRVFFFHFILSFFFFNRAKELRTKTLEKPHLSNSSTWAPSPLVLITEPDFTNLEDFEENRHIQSLLPFGQVRVSVCVLRDIVGETQDLVRVTTESGPNLAGKY